MLSLLFIFIQLPGNNLDELRLIDCQFFFDVIFFLDGLIIGSKDKLFDLLFSEIFLQIFHNLGQAFLSDDLRVLALIDKKSVCLLDVLVAVLLAHLHDHDLQKFLEVDLRLIKFGVLLAISQISDQVAYLFIAGIETEGSQDYL